MNNAISFYRDNKAEIKSFIQSTGARSSNYEFEMISTFSNDKEHPTDAISIITDLAKSGKINPEAIDLVKLYDEYMKKLTELNAANDLRFLGNALLCVSILLNLKSRFLKGLSFSDFEQIEVDEDYIDDYIEGIDEAEQLKLPSNNVISFNEVLERRTSTKLNRSRVVTLNDLIRHIKFYEERERRRELENTLERRKKFSKKYSKTTNDDILDMAQDEYAKFLAEKMDQNLAKILERAEKVEITDLKILGFTKPTAYMAILFLASKGRYKIEQEEFYGDLFVKNLSELEKSEREQEEALNG